MTTNAISDSNGSSNGGSSSLQQQQQQQQDSNNQRVSRERVKKKGLLLGIKSPFKFGSSAKNKKEDVNGIKNNSNINSNSNNSNSSVIATKQTVEKAPKKQGRDQDDCAGCGQRLGDGHALMAMDTQYHVWCFKCTECGSVLQGEYMGREGRPYCERDYQDKFGVKCTYCGRFISGKVLQAGNNNHFHPTCARCTKCGDPFGDGEEMFLQGAAIWHPRCGPGPDETNTTTASDMTPFDDHPDDSTSVASGPFLASRASSPGASLRRGDSNYSSSFSRSTTHVSGWSSSQYQPRSIYNASSCYSLRRPLEPGDRIDSLSSIRHFHLPPSRRANSSSCHSRSSTGLAHSSMMAASSSCTPKPGYGGSDLRSRSAISPGPGMHFGDYESTGGGDEDSASRSYR